MGTTLIVLYPFTRVPELFGYTPATMSPFTLVQEGGTFLLHHGPALAIACVRIHECKLEGPLCSFYSLSPKTFPDFGSWDSILGGRRARIVLLWVRWMCSPGLIHFIWCSLRSENQTNRSLCPLKERYRYFLMSTHIFSVCYIFSFICFSFDDCAKSSVWYAVICI